MKLNLKRKILLLILLSFLFVDLILLFYAHNKYGLFDLAADSSSTELSSSAESNSASAEEEYNHPNLDSSNPEVFSELPDESFFDEIIIESYHYAHEDPDIFYSGESSSENTLPAQFDE